MVRAWVRVRVRVSGRVRGGLGVRVQVRASVRASVRGRAGERLEGVFKEALDEPIGNLVDLLLRCGRELSRCVHSAQPLLLHVWGSGGGRVRARGGLELAHPTPTPTPSSGLRLSWGR